MTDTLIARLRDMAFAPYSPKLMLEAADRINALQSELGRLYREHTEDLDAASDAMEFAEKERDQLRARLTSLEVELSEVDKITNRVRLENAKLRAEIGIGGKALKKCMEELQEMVACRNAVFDLKAEIATLKIRMGDSGVELQSLAAGAAPQQAEPPNSYATNNVVIKRKSQTNEGPVFTGC